MSSVILLLKVPSIPDIMMELILLIVIVVILTVAIIFGHQWAECHEALGFAERMSEQRRQKLVEVQTALEKLQAEKSQVMVDNSTRVAEVVDKLSPPFNMRYNQPVWLAAMNASYALEGVKDQAVINVMVADSLLTKPAIYKQRRDLLVGRISPEDIALLDGFILNGVDSIA